MSDSVAYPQFSADGLPITYVPNPFGADGKPADGQWKTPVRVHTTGVITLSGLQTVDTVSLMEGDRVLVKDQADFAENGIYVASATVWRRALDMYLWPQFVGAVVAAEEGSATDSVWYCYAPAGGTVGVTANNWISVSQFVGTLPTFTPLRALASDVGGDPIASPTTAQELAYVSGVTSAVQQQFNFLLNEAGAAFTIAVAGTNAAAAAQSTANTALNTATPAYSIAVAGTNAAATAQSTANSAYALAEAGTNIGSLAYTVATALGDRYVRTTRFASIGAGTSGTAALPADATAVLDDFGGGVDAVITTIVASRPSFTHAYTAAGAVVTTSFAANGAYALSGIPSAYPVALVYRVRQKLSQYDSTSADIIGDYDVEQTPPPLGSLPDVNIPTPLAGQRLIFDGSIWQAQYSDVISSHSAFTYYLDGTSTTDPGYEVLTTVPTGSAEVQESVDVTTATSPKLIDQYISGTFGRTLLDAGIWEYNTYATANRNNCSLLISTYRLSGTVETLLWSVTSAELTNSASAIGLYSVEAFGSNIPVNMTDRLLVRYYAAKTGSGSATVSLYHNGTYHYTHIHTPLATVHNTLAGLQGGTTNEYYHTTAVEKATILPAYALAQTGTNAAATAQSTANSAYSLAQTGTNLGSAAFAIAVAGTNAAAVALSTANSAYALSQSGTLLHTANVTNGTTTASSGTVYLADATSGSVVLLLPSAAANLYSTAQVKKVDSTGNYVYVRASGANTIDGSAEYMFNAQYTAMHVVCNGTNWFIL